MPTRTWMFLPGAHDIQWMSDLRRPKWNGEARMSIRLTGMADGWNGGTPAAAWRGH